MAVEVACMKPILGAVLLWFADDAVAGDLLEEYREERLPKSGRLRAELWYLRQILSLVRHRIPSGLLISWLLSVLCAGWLVAMETRLQHRGFVTRSYNDSVVIVQVLLALFAVSARRAEGLRSVTWGLTAFVLLDAASALFEDLSAPHFEGYALIAAILFITQSALTLATLWRRRVPS
jgi:hypothetical protein